MFANSPSPIAVTAITNPANSQNGPQMMSQTRTGIATAAVASLARSTESGLIRANLGETAEAPLARLELAQRFEEVALAKVRPERLGDVDLRVRHLPEQEVRQADLAARADEEIGVGDPGRAQALRDRLLGDRVGLDLAATHTASDRAHGGRDLLAGAVRERQDDGQAIVVLGLLDAVPERLLHVARQLPGVADDEEPYAVLHHAVELVGQVVLQEPHEARHLVGRAAPVLGGERVQRQILDAELVRELDDRLDRRLATPVPVEAVQAPALRPAPVAVHDDGDVPRQPAGVDSLQGQLSRCGLWCQRHRDLTPS